MPFHPYHATPSYFSMGASLSDLDPIIDSADDLQQRLRNHISVLAIPTSEEYLERLDVATQILWRLTAVRKTLLMAAAFIEDRNPGDFGRDNSPNPPAPAKGPDGPAPDLESPDPELAAFRQQAETDLQEAEALLHEENRQSPDPAILAMPTEIPNVNIPDADIPGPRIPQSEFRIPHSPSLPKIRPMAPLMIEPFLLESLEGEARTLIVPDLKPSMAGAAPNLTAVPQCPRRKLSILDRELKKTESLFPRTEILTPTPATNRKTQNPDEPELDSEVTEAIEIKPIKEPPKEPPESIQPQNSKTKPRGS